MELNTEQLKSFLRVCNAFNERIRMDSQGKENVFQEVLRLENPEAMVIAALAEALCVSWERVEPEFRQYQQYSESAKRLAIENQQKEDALQNINKVTANLQSVADQLQKGIDLADKNLANFIAEQTKALEGVVPSESVKDTFFKIDSHFRKIKEYKPADVFKVKMFHGLPFPKGTTSYIGARTGRGKSASLVNIAREALNAGKSTLFVTLELSSSQLFDRFLLSKQWEMHGSISESSLTSCLPAWAINEDGTVNAVLALNHWLKTRINEQQSFAYGGDGIRYPSQFLSALEYTQDVIASERFAIADVRGLSLSRILSIIRNASQEVVLIDYVQKLPSAEQGRKDGYERLQDVSQKIVDVSVQSQKIILAAAQFNRASTTKDQDSDQFSDASFREAGDLEQDAHNAVGIGRNGINARFFEVLKARESHHTGLRKQLVWEGSHCFMSYSNECKQEEASNGAKNDKPRHKF